jgi:hypothetical protein
MFLEFPSRRNGSPKVRSQRLSLQGAQRRSNLPPTESLSQRPATCREGLLQRSAPRNDMWAVHPIALGTKAAELDPAMRSSGISVGLLTNFNLPGPVDGLHRTVVSLPSKPPATAPCSPCSPHLLRAEKTWPRFAPAVAKGDCHAKAAASTAFATNANPAPRGRNGMSPDQPISTRNPAPTGLRPTRSPGPQRADAAGARQRRPATGISGRHVAVNPARRPDARLDCPFALHPLTTLSSYHASQAVRGNARSLEE